LESYVPPILILVCRWGWGSISSLISRAKTREPAQRARKKRWPIRRFSYRFDRWKPSGADHNVTVVDDGLHGVTRNRESDVAGANDAGQPEKIGAFGSEAVGIDAGTSEGFLIGEHNVQRNVGSGDDGSLGQFHAEGCSVSFKKVAQIDVVLVADPAGLFVVDATFIVVIKKSPYDVAVGAVVEDSLGKITKTPTVAIVLDDFSPFFEDAENLLEAIV